MHPRRYRRGRDAQDLRERRGALRQGQAQHTHEGDNEIFYFLSGTGEYNDNGTIVEVGPGDTTICSDGELHGLKNTGDVPLEFIALILYS